MLKSAGTSRAALLGCLFAFVTFSYALATSNDGAQSKAASRGCVGSTPLHFTNPFFPSTTDRDLGDIVAGSSFLRIARATGGVGPYRFASSATVNQVLFSEQFEQSVWDTSNGGNIVTPNAAIAPDGSATADRIQAGDPNVSTELLQIVNNPNLRARDVIFSIFIKLNTTPALGGKLPIVIFDNVSGFRTRDVLAEVTTDGFTRVAIKTTIHSDATIIKVGFGPGAAPDRDFFVWGAQFEIGAGDPSGYKRTTTTPASDSPFGVIVPIADAIPEVDGKDKIHQQASVALNGLVSGITTNAFNVTPVRFQITVVDKSASAQSGTNGIGNFVTEFFRLTLVNTTTFRFAIDTMPNAVQLQDYFFPLAIINPITFPLKYSVSNITFNGAAITKFEDIGLSLSDSDGVIYGKPLFSGTLSFTANSVNAAGTTAKSRDGSKDGQDFSLTIDANTIVSTTLFTTGLQIHGDTAKRVGTLHYTGIPHFNSTNFKLLVGQDLQLRVGRYVAPNPNLPAVVLSGFGTSIKTTTKPIAKTKNVANFKGKVSSKGLVTITVSNEAFGDVFEPLTNNTVIPLSVYMRIGGVTSGSESLLFDVKKRGTKFTLTYHNGKNSSLGGGFLITNVTGKDSQGGAGDEYLVKFLAFPPASVTPGNFSSVTPFQGPVPASGTKGIFAGSSNAQVCIGPLFQDNVTVTTNGHQVKFSGPIVPEKVAKLSMDSKSGKGFLQTGLIASGETGVPGASSGIQEGATANFTMHIGLSNGGGASIFAGEGGIQIFSRKDNWNENPVRK